MVSSKQARATMCYNPAPLVGWRGFMKKKIQIVAGILVGIALLWFLFRQSDWRAVLSSLRVVSPIWLILGVLVMTQACFSRTMRWAYIVRSSKWVPLRPVFSATQIGFLAIVALPARLGEIVRVLVLGRLAKLPFSTCMAAAALDRVADFVSLLAVIAVALLSYKPVGNVRLPSDLLGSQSDILVSANSIQKGELATAGVVLAMMGFLVGVYLYPRLLLGISDACFGVVSKRLAGRVHAFIEHFVEGLSILRSPSDMAKAVFFSLATWGIYLLTVTIVLLAFHVEFPWYTPFFIEVLVAAMNSIPLAPGGVGQFHLGVVVGLKIILPDMELSQAFAISLVAYVVSVVPVIVLGIFCLFWEELRLVELSQEGERTETGIGGEVEGSRPD
jgi:uncharacterized membrane protein YbhN (UPF0104 family)